MPNWVSNTLRVNKQDLFRIVNKKNEVDFNLVHPMPQSLSCESGSSNDYAIYYYLSNRCQIDVNAMHQSTLATTLITNSFSDDWLTEIYNRLQALMQKPNFDADALFKDGEVLMDNYQKYGASTWYEWCNSNWGCKWNASQTAISDDPNDSNYVIIYFNTPWGAPCGWLMKLAEFNIAFHCEWVEEQGFHGEYISDGSGDFVSNELPFINFNDDDDDDCDDSENADDTSSAAMLADPPEPFDN